VRKIVFISVFVLFLIGCFSDYGLNEGNLIINLGGGNGRSAIPWPPNENGILADIEYIITLSGNWGSIPINAKGGDIITETVPAGLLNVNVKAYYLDRNSLYAEGNNTTNIMAGQNNPVTVQMLKAFNKFSINGETYEINSGYTIHYGDYFGNNLSNIDLFLGEAEAEGVSIYFEMLVPLENEKLIEGIYTFDEEASKAFTYRRGNIWIYKTGGIEYDGEYEYGSEVLLINGGTVKIFVSGMGNDAIYTIDVDCTLEVYVFGEDGFDTIDGGYVKGVYRGTLNYEEGF
jgi:hypothetical protein